MLCNKSCDADEDHVKLVCMSGCSAAEVFHGGGSDQIVARMEADIPTREIKKVLWQMVEE